MAASDNDMRAHQETYAGVMNLLKWGTAAVAVVAVLIVLWIAR